MTTTVTAPAPRPTPPPFRLPAPRRRPGGVVASVLLHSALLLLLVVHFGSRWASGGDGAPGPRGGGGGAGGAPHYVELPAPSAPAPARPPAPTVTPLPQPLPVEQPLPLAQAPLTLPVSAPTLVGEPAPGAGGGSGAGPGSGGGIGSGVGTGVGSDTGSGRGGDGAYITPPNLRTLLLPADCAHGRFTVQFWVAADGSVSRVSVDPPPKGSSCQREMQQKMMGYRFMPARTRDGRAVAATIQMHVERH